MYSAPPAVGRDLGLPVEYFQTGNGIEGKRGNGRGRLLSPESDGREYKEARDHQQNRNHITVRTGEPPEGPRRIPHFRFRFQGDALITVLFDESRAGLGSRNSKIDTSSRQQKTLDSKK